MTTLPATARDITVTISDGEDAISGASVTIEGVTATTGSNGKAAFEDVAIGTHTVTVTKSGYADYSGSITVAAATVTFDVTLTPVRTLSFTINDGTDPVQGAVVAIGETTGTTGSSGGCTLNSIADGSQTVTVTAEGFTTKTETITVSEDSTSFTISIVASG